MNQLCYWNGELIADQELAISVFDIGFVQGVTVSEQLRTFSGQLFQLQEHVQRLRRSLEIIGIHNIDFASLTAEAGTIACHNHSLLQPGDDLGLTVFVTPGAHTDPAANNHSEPNVGMYTVPVPFHRWAAKYAAGEHLVVSSVRQVPDNCWSTELKCRSRMHYFLADQEAQRKRPGARALLLDQDGFVAEASTASVILYREAEGFVAPMPQKVLPSISIRVLKTLAHQERIAFVHRDITVDDLRSADEVLLSSTSPCILPVCHIDDLSIGKGVPGNMFRRLVAAWSRMVEVDIEGQATRFASR